MAPLLERNNAQVSPNERLALPRPRTGIASGSRRKRQSILMRRVLARPQLRLVTAEQDTNNGSANLAVYPPKLGLCCGTADFAGDEEWR